MFGGSLNMRVIKILNLVTDFLILLNVLLVPLFLSRQVFNFYILPKNYLFFGLIIINLLFWAIRIVIDKKVFYRRSILDWALLCLFGLALFSAVFSVNIYDSFFGRPDYFTISFVSIIFSILFYSILINQITTTRKWQGVINVLLLSGGLSALWFLLRSIFNLVLPGFENIFNPVSAFNSLFGLWTVFQIVLAGGLLMQKDANIGRTLALFFLVILQFVTLLLLGFEILWWLLLIGFILLLLLGVVFINQVRLGWLSILFVGLIFSVIFIVFGSPKAIQSALPAEISLSSKVSWDITSDTVFSGVKSFLLGSGLGSFGVDFSRFKPLDFNYNLMAWSLRFNQPANTVFAWLAEGGILFFLVFIFILLFVLGYAIHTLYRLRQSGWFTNLANQMDADQIPMMVIPVFSLLVGWLVLWVGLVFSFFGPVLWWLWWLCLGLLILGLHYLGDNEVIKTKQWTLEETPQHSLAFSFATIIVMAMAVMIGVFGIKFYLAEYHYTKAMLASNLDEAQSYLTKAVNGNGHLDIYHVALARSYLLQAGNEVRRSEPQAEKVASWVAQAVNQAKLATDISPKSVAIWENLATMYENAMILVPDAHEWAVKSLTTAQALEPMNPVLPWRLGNVYAQNQNWDKAIESYEKAIELKRDFLGAYTGLASIYEQQSDLDKAIEYYSIILPASANNTDVLFNLGRLFYNRKQQGDWNKAEELWQRAIKFDSNHVNTLYSLGLLAENRGDRAKALQYYYKVKDLIGDNSVDQKIRNLVGGINEESSTE